MSETRASTGGSEACTYEIRVQGHLDSRWASWFEGLVLERHSDGTTAIRGEVADQAALHGLLHRMRDLGLPLVSVEQLDLEPLVRSSRLHRQPRRRSS